MPFYIGQAKVVSCGHAHAARCASTERVRLIASRESGYNNVSYGRLNVPSKEFDMHGSLIFAI